MSSLPSGGLDTTRENEAIFRHLVDAVTEYAIYMLDADGRVKSWNAGAERIEGFTAAEVMGHFFGRFFPEEDRLVGKPETLLERAKKEGRARDEGWRIRKDGTRFIAESVLSPIYENGRLAGFAKVIHDVSDRKAMQDLQESRDRLQASEKNLRLLTAELKESRNQLDTIINGVDTAITAQDNTGRLIFVNTAAARHLGFANPEALLSAPIADIMGKYEVLDEHGNPFPVDKLPGRLALQGVSSDAPTVIRYRERATGAEKWSLVKASPVRDGGGRITMVINFFHDITALKQVELAERSANEQLRIILAGISDAILVQDPQGALLYLNDTGARMLGYPDAESVMELTRHPERREEVRRRFVILDEGGNPFPPEATPNRLALKGEKPPPMTLRYRMTPESEERWVISSAKPVFDAQGRLQLVIGILHDVTELRMAEERLRQSQKMEAVGRLAGGIAHDFNNLLTAINGYSDLLLGKLAGQAGEMPESVREIRKAGERAASLTQQLLAFSRKQMLAPKVLDLNEVLEKMDSLLRRLIGENIELRTVFAPGLGRVKADPNQIEQVILNLALNARDAMPSGGKLTMETANVELDATYVSTHLEFRQGQHVMLAITDTGLGMDPHVKAHLFEPFFTTKAAGPAGRSGTGLGLSTVFGIVKQSGGNINVYSEPGQGTSFKIYLPAVTEVPAEPEDSLAVLPDPDGGETVLVVEDEEAVRKLVQKTLADAGFQCLAAGDAESALRLAGDFPGTIHLLLTDVVLPGMNGKWLAEKLLAARPEMGVLYMSGYTDNTIVHHGVLDPGTQFLNKPFSAHTLKHMVRLILAKKA